MMRIELIDAGLLAKNISPFREARHKIRQRQGI
jgi:hypothetical protein